MKPTLPEDIAEDLCNYWRLNIESPDVHISKQIPIVTNVYLKTFEIVQNRMHLTLEGMKTETLAISEIVIQIITTALLYIIQLIGNWESYC